MTERCDELLNRSIGIYKEVFGHYQALANEVADSVPEKIQLRLAKIDILCTEVKSSDDRAAELIASSYSLPESTARLVTAREELLGKLHEMNLNIVTKANKTKSLLLHEIKGMHTGRNALHGYGKAVGHVKKNIVNGSF